MEDLLVDTAVWIHALRRGETVAAIRRVAPEATPWLSAVVLEELYAGARDRDRGIVRQLEREFESVSRIETPSFQDWKDAGLVVGEVAQVYGYDQIARGRLTNDALIAMSAARRGFTVLTTNRKDYARLAEFRPLRWRLVERP